MSEINSLQEEIVTRLAPRSPMSIVQAHWTPQSKDRSHTIYFQHDGVRGPGFGNDNPAILAELAPVLEELCVTMEGAEFFISMIPDVGYSFARENIPHSIAIPPFGKAFAAIGAALIEQGVQNDCDIEINVSNEQSNRFSNLTPKHLKLSIYERVKTEFGRCDRQRLHLPISLDENGADCQAILAWYAGAKHGLIIWKWKRPDDVQVPDVSANNAKLIA